MDPAALVEGGAAGLTRIAHLYRERGFPVGAVYLIRRVGEDDSNDWVIILVLTSMRLGVVRDVIYAHVDMRRAGLLPKIDGRVRIDAVGISHVEASRLLRWTRTLGPLPVSISETYFDGLFIYDALVAEDELRETAEAA